MRGTRRSGTATSRTAAGHDTARRGVPARLADPEGPSPQTLHPHRRSPPGRCRPATASGTGRAARSCVRCWTARPRGWSEARARHRPSPPPPASGVSGPRRPRSTVSSTSSPSVLAHLAPHLLHPPGDALGSSSSRSPRLEGSARDSSRSSSERRVANRDIRRVSCVAPAARTAGGFGVGDSHDQEAHGADGSRRSGTRRSACNRILK